MARLQRFILLLLLPFSLFAETREVVIFHTTDTHASRRWPQLATILKEQLKQAPHHLLIDCGDTIQGSPMATISKGRAAIEPILALPYDVWVPGNHEADFGAEALKEIFALAKDKLLCANFRIRTEPAPVPWKLFEKNGLRIAVIGAEASYFKHWLLPEEFSKYEVRTAQQALKKQLPLIAREKPDIVILATHQAWFEERDIRHVNEVQDIAKFFPEIHLIIGAHSHREIPGRIIGHNTWYVQAGCHAEKIGKITVRFDTESRKIDFQSELIPVPEETPPDEELLARLQPWLEKEQDFLNLPTGIVLPQEIRSQKRPGQGNPISELLCMAIAEASGAEIAFHGVLTEAPIPAGPLSRKTLFDVVPYENTIVTAELTPDELTAVMTEQWRQRTSYRFCGPWNARFLLGSKLHFQGTGDDTPVENRRYKIAINSHTAAGSGVFPILRYIIERPAANRVNTGISTRDALEAFLKKHADSLPQPKIWITK